MLIKLSGVPHPDLNGGQPQAVYIDASRVLLICASHVEQPRLDSIRRRKEIISQLWAAAEKVHEKVHAYVPNMTDTVALEWMQTARAGCGEVSEAYRAVNQLGPDVFHKRVDCTEVQLACGTALEHGVMLTRVWVSDPIDDVYAKVFHAMGGIEGNARAALSGL